MSEQEVNVTVTTEEPVNVTVSRETVLPVVELGEVIPGPPGPPGPPGGDGPAGPPGPAGPAGGVSFLFTQGAPSAVWDVVHNLTRFPSVTVVDTGGTEVWPTLHYVDSNHLTLTFGSPTSGKAYLN